MGAQRSGGAKALLAGAAAAALFINQSSFVPAPKTSASRVPVAAAVGTAAAAVSAAPAFAGTIGMGKAEPDAIGEAAKQLTTAAYPFMKDIDWSSMLYLQKPGGSAGALEWLKAIDQAIVVGEAMDGKLLQAGAIAHHKAVESIDDKGLLTKPAFTEVNAAIGRMIASVPEDKIMSLYNTFDGLVGKDVPEYLMSTVKAENARTAYAGFLNFKDVVKSHPIPEKEAETRIAEAALKDVVAASAKLSAASYPLIKSVDWTSDLFVTPLPGVTAKEAIKAIDAAIVMGADMDPKLLKEAAAAHHKAIGSVDAKGVTSAADYAGINAALGKLIASVPSSDVMDVYNAFAKIVNPVVPSKLFSMLPKPLEAVAAYKALLEFKDVVKAAQV